MSRCSEGLAWWVDRVCVALLILLVLDVWLGVLVRYAIPLPITFTEEAARYLMIWTALLAVSSCIARREHIGVLLVFDRLPHPARRLLLGGFDLLALGFFLTLFYFGIVFTIGGAARVTMIFQVSKAVPFAAVPVSAAFACVQVVLVGLRDQFRFTQDLKSASGAQVL
ncbi:MAG: TRAP transporter small permease [Gammaproteobacteria bacterium]|nr:TRAP transporter small permease [Gammaproteobacteria bacterium]